MEPAGLGTVEREVPRRGTRGSRGALPGYEWLQGTLTDPDRNDKVRNLKKVADDLGCTLAQLASPGARRTLVSPP